MLFYHAMGWMNGRLQFMGGAKIILMTQSIIFQNKLGNAIIIFTLKYIKRMIWRMSLYILPLC